MDSKNEKDRAFDRHTRDGFRCTDPACMFPARYETWCTREVESE